MNPKVKIAPALIALMSLAAMSASAQMPDRITGQRVDYDKATGNSVIYSPHITSEDGLVIDADTAQYTVDENAVPRAMELSGNIRLRIGDKMTRADQGIYYPELQILTSPHISVSSTASPMEIIDYKCSSGTLLANGSPVAGGTACYGYTQVSCGGSGGNTVTIVKLKYSCPGG
ncbi:hypothetical protein GGR77_001573 [Xanthomonas translucens]